MVNQVVFGVMSIEVIGGLFDGEKGFLLRLVDQSFFGREDGRLVDRVMVWSIRLFL